MVSDGLFNIPQNGLMLYAQFCEAVWKERNGTNIGEMAKYSGLNGKVIHDYEKIGLIQPVGRSESGYRRYTEQDSENPSFIRHAHDVDFSLARVRTLLQLKSNSRRINTEVRRLTAEYITTLQAKIGRLQDMVNTLENWHDCCCGDNRPDCPITEQPSDTESCRTNTEAV